MSQRGDELAGAIMTALTQHMGVSKAAGARGELLLVQGAITPLCETIATYERHIRRTTKELKRHNKVLKAIARQPEQVPHGWTPYRPQEWRTELVPNLPPRQMNGHSYPGGNDDRTG